MDTLAKKRLHSASVPLKRTPLAETNANVPLPVLKKAKLKSAASTLIKQDAQPTAVDGAKASAASAKSARLVGDELKSWQASWRKIMRESVIYFDTQGCDSNNQGQHLEQKKAQRALKLVGCMIAPFYDRDVSIIVSRRPFSSSKMYPANDIFHDATALKIKVWDFDKVFRFLKNLGVSDSTSQESTGNLSHLLKEEKIFGSTDRDPNARRDDLYYLEKNFVYVYDLSQAVRPIIIREWHNDSYPAFHLTLDGKCPFVPDTSDNLERKKLRRYQKFEATKEYRELLKKVSNMISSAKGELLLSNTTFTATSTSSDPQRDAGTGIDLGDGNEEKHDPTTEIDELSGQDPYEFRPPAAFSRNSSVLDPSNNSISTSKFYDVAASGFNGASNAVQFSMDSTLNSVAIQQNQQGNGLGPAMSQIMSKNLNNLKRRIFMKRQSTKEDAKKEVESKPGYCENCRVKYDHFDDHIASNRHRNFACNDKNFKDIDELIETLNESKSMGYVSSNGDYSFCS